jgi:hypothetical protein
VDGGFPALEPHPAAWEIEGTMRIVVNNSAIAKRFIFILFPPFVHHIWWYVGVALYEIERA